MLKNKITIEKCFIGIVLFSAIFFMIGFKIGVGEPITIVEYRNQSCELTEDFTNKYYKSIRNDSENKLNFTFQSPNTEIYPKCKTEMKVIRRTSYAGGFREWYDVCYRCSDLNKSIVPDILDKGDWICPT